MQRGRESRSLYPLRALDEAGDPIRARVRAGDRVRFLEDLPSRLAVLGDQAALIPEQWGKYRGARLLILQPGVVRVLRNIFDELWRRSIAFPGMCAVST